MKSFILPFYSSSVSVQLIALNYKKWKPKRLTVFWKSSSRNTFWNYWNVPIKLAKIKDTKHSFGKGSFTLIG